MQKSARKLNLVVHESGFSKVSEAELKKGRITTDHNGKQLNMKAVYIERLPQTIRADITTRVVNARDPKAGDANTKGAGR